MVPRGRNSTDSIAGSARPTNGALVTFMARGRTLGSALAVFAVAPNAGTELACVSAGAGAAARLEHLLAPKLTYYLAVGTPATGTPAAPTGGDILDVQVAVAMAPSLVVPPRG